MKMISVRLISEIIVSIPVDDSVDHDNLPTIVKAQAQASVWQQLRNRRVEDLNWEQQQVLISE